MHFYKHLRQSQHPKLNEGFTSFWYSILWNPILYWKQRTRLTCCWKPSGSPGAKKQWSLVFRILEESGYCCWEASLQVYSNHSKHKGRRSNHRSKEPERSSHMLGWHSRDSAAEPLVWVRAWEGCQKPHWKFGINIILMFRIIPHIRGRSTPQDNTVLHQQQLD